MGGGRQRRPLHRRPLVAPVVPQHDLARVRASDHDVGVELGKRRRHDSGLTVEEWGDRGDQGCLDDAGD